MPGTQVPQKQGTGLQNPAAGSTKSRVVQNLQGPRFYKSMGPTSHKTERGVVRMPGPQVTQKQRGPGSTKSEGRFHKTEEFVLLNLI